MRIHDPRYFNVNTLACPLYHDQIQFANLGTQDYYVPLNELDYSIFALIKPRLELAFDYDKSYQQTLSNIDSAIRRLLTGEALSDTDIYRISMSWKHTPKAPCFVIMLQNSSGHLSDNMRNIQLLLPQSILFPFDNQIIAINYNTEELNDRKFAEKLSKYASRTGTRIGVSTLLYGFLQLYIGYSQCQTALLGSSEKSVRCFSEICFPYLLEQLEATPHPSAFLDPGIEQLVKTNPDYGRELVMTLAVYLMNGSNISSSAAALSVHRHTVQYRIDKMETLLQTDLSALPDTRRIQMYLSCQLLLKRLAKQPELTS